MSSTASPTSGRPIAPRLVTWLLIILGACEIPWVIYLVFAQQESFQAFHLNIATLGLGIAAVVLSSPSCISLLKDWPSAPAWCVATATLVLFLASITTLSRNVEAKVALRPDHVPLIIAIPGAMAAGYAAFVCLRGNRAVHEVGIKIAAMVLALVALAFLARTVQHFTDPQSTAVVTRARAIVVLLDTGETVGLLGAGIASLRGKPRSTLVFSMIGGVLLICDAWTNVLTAASGLSFDSAIFYLIVGEVPSTVLCIWAARCAARELRERRTQRAFAVLAP